MGSLVGHVAPGFGFFIIGLWHLYNHLKLLALSGPPHFKSLPWFPTTLLHHRLRLHLRRLELYLIMAATTTSVAMELFIGPNRHQPLDPDGTIPSSHLHNFEHSSISLTFFVYSLFAVSLDHLTRRRGQPIPAQDEMLQLIAAVAFGQQLLLFHLHSTDHMGVEGQYHRLLQLVIFVSLLSTLFGIGYSGNFIISYVRSLSIVFQGVWLMVIGFALWTPALIPKGCFMNFEDGHTVVRCNDDASLYRAKALANIQFSWFLILLAVFAASCYVVMMLVYCKDNKVEYVSLEKDSEAEEDVEAQRIGRKLGETQSFVNGSNKAIDHMEK